MLDFTEKDVIFAENLKQKIMATPIRSAPVLVGKEAEEFIERWQQSLYEPLRSPISEREQQRIKKFIAKQKVK
jgi:molybdopterin-guanine dinucleotide biosynthesis protein A